MEVAVTRAGQGRGEVHLVRLDPTVGSEIQKARPRLVVSPDELNQYLRTVIIAPMTTGIHGGCRVAFSADLASSPWTRSARSMPNDCSGG
jgi:mRNA-degrading endonuclease toxin of MazEF toxin-antitoxin module